MDVQGLAGPMIISAAGTLRCLEMWVLQCVITTASIVPLYTNYHEAAIVCRSAAQYLEHECGDNSWVLIVDLKMPVTRKNSWRVIVVSRTEGRIVTGSKICSMSNHVLYSTERFILNHRNHSLHLDSVWTQVHLKWDLLKKFKLMWSNAFFLFKTISSCKNFHPSFSWTTQFTLSRLMAGGRGQGRAGRWGVRGCHSQK